MILKHSSSVASFAKGLVAVQEPIRERFYHKVYFSPEELIVTNQRQESLNFLRIIYRFNLETMCQNTTIPPSAKYSGFFLSFFFLKEETDLKTLQALGS